jgi:hypothetical protein
MSGMTPGIKGMTVPDKPPVARLLAYIFSAAISGGMITLLVLGGAVLVYLGYIGMPTGNYFVLLFGIIFVLSFLRGCKDWQNDLDNYQKHLAEARRLYESRPQ